MVRADAFERPSPHDGQSLAEIKANQPMNDDVRLELVRWSSETYANN